MPSPSQEFASSEQVGRRIELYDFDDAGLTTGPRTIHIHLPDGYDHSGDRYPVVYFSDGGNIFSEVADWPGGDRALDRIMTDGRLGVDLAYDALIADGLIHPTIFVGIGVTTDVRGTTLSPAVDKETGKWGRLDGYYQFISERLKPYIDSHYRTRPEAASTGIAGYSMGGSSSFLMAFSHPETFGMAGCMSSAPGWHLDYALSLVRKDTRGQKPVRFWLDAGGEEYDVWRDAAHAYELLEEKGWVAGDDLAAFLDYSSPHKLDHGRRRIREMLYFLLRKGPLRMESYRLVCAANPAASEIDLRAGGRPIVGAEAWYAHGLRLTVPNPNIKSSNPQIASVDSEDPLLLHPVGSGETMVTSTYLVHTSSLKVIA